MAARQEREVITEFLELYSNFPCLWDTGSDQYKDRDRKLQAWECLARKLREIEPYADVAYAKKKVEYMRTSYKREEKKIKESKKKGSEAGHVHVPILWYFNLLSPVFNSKGEESRTGVDTFASDEGKRPSQTEKTIGVIEKNTNRRLEQKKRKLIKTVQEQINSKLKYEVSSRAHRRGQGNNIPLREKRKNVSQTSDTKLNTFGVYVGEQLEQIDALQRQVAEKLISEVLFLAKTGNLHFDSRIQTPSSARLFNFSNNSSQSPTPSPQYIVPSPLSQYTESSVSLPPNCDRSTPSPQYIRVSNSPRHSNTPSPPTQQLSRRIPPSKSTTKQDNSIRNGTSVRSCTLTEKNRTKTMSSSSYNNSPYSSLQHILVSPHDSQPSPRQSSSSQIITNAYEENVQTTVPTKENQTSTIVHEGPAISLLAELLMDNKAK